jgi:hypothetical protein
MATKKNRDPRIQVSATRHAILKKEMGKGGSLKAAAEARFKRTDKRGR